MKKIQIPRFDRNEFRLLCETIAYTSPEYDVAGWTKLLIPEIAEIIEDNGLLGEWQVDQTRLMEKLESLTELEFLELIGEINLFWDNDNEAERAVFSALEPIQKIFHIARVKNMDMEYIISGKTQPPTQ